MDAPRLRGDLGVDWGAWQGWGGGYSRKEYRPRRSAAVADPAKVEGLRPLAPALGFLFRVAAVRGSMPRVPEGAFMQRRLAAIMVADIVGYSSLMEQAEERTAARVAACQDLIQQQVAALDGRVFNTAGDASFVEFASPINALRCATEIRTALAGTAMASLSGCASACTLPNAGSAARISSATA